MRKILKYFGFYDNGKTTVTEKQCNINSVSKCITEGKEKTNRKFVTTPKPKIKPAPQRCVC